MGVVRGSEIDSYVSGQLEKEGRMAREISIYQVYTKKTKTAPAAG